MRNTATSGKRIGYGWLYNWYAVDHVSGLAPDGWSVPSDAQWTAMTDYLIAEYAHITSDNVGGALKSTRNEWDSPNTGATNEFGFEGLPGGFYTPFLALGTGGRWWTATERVSNAWRRFLSSGSAVVDRNYFMKYLGFSVRCIQDKAVGEVDGGTGTLTDVEGNIYKYVVIGDYRWMAENLRTTKYRNGDTIPEITDNTAWSADTAGARCAYNNDHYYVYPPKR